MTLYSNIHNHIVRLIEKVILTNYAINFNKIHIFTSCPYYTAKLLNHTVVECSTMSDYIAANLMIYIIKYILNDHIKSYLPKYAIVFFVS